MRRLLLLLVLLLVVLGALGGCVAVPTSGPVERIEGQPPACQDCVNIEIDPPAAGAEPKQIVEGFLRASSNFQPNYSVAREFLSDSAAERWRPEAGVSVYTGSPVVSGRTVILDGRLVGSLGPDRAYRAQDRPLRVDFGLVLERGEWRINTPPAGLLVAEFSFTTFYQSYLVYFVGNNATLVPDRIYLPNLRNQANIASVLMTALLSGPSAWLKPAVTSALPPDTSLRVDSVTVSDGVAAVPLSEGITRLNDQQRRLMAAQVIYTLRQAIGISGVRFSVNQRPFPIPGGDPDTFVVSIDDVPPDVTPVPTLAGEQLYAVRGGAVQLVGADPGAPDPRPMPGPLGAGRYAVESLAVSVNSTDVAVVTNRQTVLRRAPTGGGQVQSVLTGVRELRRPQFSRYGELWAVGRSAGRQRMWVFLGDRRTEVQAPFLREGALVAFKISPDGTRLAAILAVGGRTELGVARITRADSVLVDGWRPLDINRSNTANLSVIRDVGWADPTDLVVLAGPSDDVPLGAYRVGEDAFRVSAEGEPFSWDPVALTVQLRTQTAVIVARDGHTYRDDGQQWLPYLDRVQAVAYPG